MTIRIQEAQTLTIPTDAQYCKKLCGIRPVSPALGMDIVTSSQTLREKDIQPSKLNFGFIGLG